MIKCTSLLVLDLLSKHTSQNGDIKVQHAILSTLKNLAIPKQNKRALLDDGLIDVVYPLLDSNHEIVVFKLLGTFRMVIDGQGKTKFSIRNMRATSNVYRKLYKHCEQKKMIRNLKLNLVVIFCHFMEIIYAGSFCKLYVIYLKKTKNDW